MHIIKLTLHLRHDLRVYDLVPTFPPGNGCFSQPGQLFSCFNMHLRYICKVLSNLSNSKEIYTCVLLKEAMLGEIIPMDDYCRASSSEMSLEIQPCTVCMVCECRIRVLIGLIPMVNSRSYTHPLKLSFVREPLR